MAGILVSARGTFAPTVHYLLRIELDVVQVIVRYETRTKVRAVGWVFGWLGYGVSESFVSVMTVVESAGPKQ